MLTLTNYTKDLMLEAIDGYPSLTPIMHQLSHYTSRNGVLVWLIRNKITGYNLLSWLKNNHNNSVMGMVQFIVMRHNKDLEVKPIIMNKDWIK